MSQVNKVDFGPCLHEHKVSKLTWRMPRGSNTPQLCCAARLMPRQLAAGYLTALSQASVAIGKYTDYCGGRSKIDLIATIYGENI